MKKKLLCVLILSSVFFSGCSKKEEEIEEVTEEVLVKTTSNLEGEVVDSDKIVTSNSGLQIEYVPAPIEVEENDEDETFEKDEIEEIKEEEPKIEEIVVIDESPTVYIGSEGSNTYHNLLATRDIPNPQKTTIQKAMDKGYKPCTSCFKEGDLEFDYYEQHKVENHETEEVNEDKKSTE